LTPSPLFSVVVPTYNRLPLLAAALDSVWRQTLADYEVIVVDDGSTDGTREWLAEQATRVRVCRQENKGPGAARNLGAGAARGRYIVFLDSDDLWFPWTLATYADVLADGAKPTSIAAALLEFSEPRELTGIGPAPMCLARHGDFLAAGANGVFVGSNMLIVERRALLDCGGFVTDRLNAEDHDLMLRLGTQPGFVQVIAPKTVAWRRHPCSETADRTSTIRGIARLVDREDAGFYPGGPERRGDRHRFITQHVRAASLAVTGSALTGEAFGLYGRSFRWHCEERRWRYLLGFPVVGIRAAFSVAREGWPERDEARRD
jgi:GT2 family glycosyltransferase